MSVLVFLVEVALGILLMSDLRVLCTQRRPVPPDSRVSTSTASIRGTVFITGTDQPVAGATIRFGSPSFDPRVERTDGGGHYEITGLRPGRYIVSASKPNFISTAYGQWSPTVQPTAIELVDGQVAADIDIELVRSSVIDGRVIDEFGDAAVDVLVEAI